jgi:hypothetical protein
MYLGLYKRIGGENKMDIDKLNPYALAMAKDLMRVRVGLPLLSALASVHYKMASITSQMHIKFNIRGGYRDATASIYYLLLLNSGGGKNSSLGLLDRWFFEDAYSKIKDTIYPYYKQLALERLAELEIKRDIHNWVKKVDNATMSGLLALAESYTLCKFGGINVEVDEIGNAITSKAELFDMLLTPFDNGEFPPTAKRTDPNAMDIDGIPVNLYCFGNKVRLLNGDSTEKAFLHYLDEGYGRRFIFVDDTSEELEQTPEQYLRDMDFSEQTRIDRRGDRVRIASLVSSKKFGKVLELDNDARYKYAVIKAESDIYIKNNKDASPAVSADVRERFFKTAKLASIYAFFDDSDVVKGCHMEQAYEVIKESSEVLARVRKVRPTHDRLLSALLLEPKPVTSQHMLQYSFINSTYTKKINEYIDLAKQLSSELGYEWDEHIKAGVTYYTVIKEQKTIKDIF